MELRADVVPKAAENFCCLFDREKGIGRYSNTNHLITLFVSRVCTLLFQVWKDATYITRDPPFTGS
jgi:hypothetical protein